MHSGKQGGDRQKSNLSKTQHFHLKFVDLNLVLWLLLARGRLRRAGFYLGHHCTVESEGANTKNDEEKRHQSGFLTPYSPAAIHFSPNIGHSNDGHLIFIDHLLYILGTVVNTLHLISPQNSPLKLVLHLQMRKLRLREVKWFFLRTHS